MKKIKKIWQLTGAKLLIVALLLATTIFYLPRSVIADTSFKSIKDTISDSAPGAVGVTHAINASTTLPIDAGGYFEVTFPADFTVVATTTLVCPGSGVGHGSGNTLQCFYASGLAATNTTITIPGVTNPGAVGTYGFSIYNKQANGTIKEKGLFRVAIVQSVTVTASVETTLTFTVAGLATSSVINGVTTTGSSTARTLDFGVLTPFAAKTLGHRLNAGTNATHGFTVTVSQDHNLLSSGGADIDSFKDGTAATTTALTWAAPSGVLGQEATYGHFGVTSQDSTLSNNDAFGTALYKGMKNSDPVEIMYNNGPSNGTSNDIGSTTVAYTVEVNPLQESGDYSNTLTYVCTPTY